MQIFCLLLGNSFGASFPIDVKEEDQAVGHLKDLIWEKVKNSFSSFSSNITAEYFELWKVDIPVDSENLGTVISFDDIARYGGTILAPTKSIGSTFGYSVNFNIRVLVRVQPPAITSEIDIHKIGVYNLDFFFVIEHNYLNIHNYLDKARRIMENIKKLSYDRKVYSDPKNFLRLPFPFPGAIKPADRFALDNGLFTFMGRRKFDNILTQIEALKPDDNFMRMFIYGTAGYGKSHILAAMACLLLREEKRVVFLPDCRKLAVENIDYIKHALFLTYAHDETKLREIGACNNLDQIKKFCKSLGEKLYFFIDQMNALDPNSDTLIAPDKKSEIMDAIGEMTYRHFCIKSSSANYSSLRYFNQKQTSEVKIAFFGGYDKVRLGCSTFWFFTY